MKRILVIADDKSVCLLLKRTLEENGYAVNTVFSAKESIWTFQVFQPDLVICDYELGEKETLEVISALLSQNDAVPIIVTMNNADVSSAVNIIRMGAYDLIEKPINQEELLKKISAGLHSAHTMRKIPARIDSSFIFNETVHSQNMMHLISKVAPTDYTVIIYGKSGTGKEGIAQLIHEQSRRSSNHFIAIDCGTLSKDLSGSELFGHEKGAFTGASEQRIGQFELAVGGTLFLDEIHNLSFAVQTSLLRVLQEKAIKRLGNTQYYKTNVRIITATNEDLLQSVQKGLFREDLYHRLNEFSLELLPLAQRKEDILFYANHFLREAGKRLHLPFTGFDTKVEAILVNYHWPGNIRELKNVINRAALFSTSAIVTEDALPEEILFTENNAEIQACYISPDNSTHINFTPTKDINNITNSAVRKAAVSAECDIILKILKQVNNNKTEAARILGVDRKTIYNKLKMISKE